MDLRKIETERLVKELSKRQEVEKIITKPYKDLKLNVNGPAIVLVVRD